MSWLLAAALAAAAGAPPVEYQVRLENAARHEARITVTYRGLPRRPAYFRMARSSPGRYALHEFAKNVYAVSAADGQGRPLAIERRDPYGWWVPAHGGTVAVTYTLFGDRADGTYSQFDASHAHLNVPATFLWAEGQDARPLRVRFSGFDPKWKIATQLKPEADGSFSARDLQYFMDSPIELSDQTVRNWALAGTNATMRIALHHLGSESDADEFAARARRIVAEHVRMWGEAARYDHGTYTFIVDALPWASGDGMEHRNSTVISGSDQLRASGFAALGTVSHEFFHSWNVERLRPAELEPFDFTRANPTPSLWFAEGFTNYYGPLAMVRAGELPVGEFAARLGRLVSTVANSPARGYGGPQEMSLRAPFVDAATAIDPTNDGVFLSYYTYGQALALALDLTLRQRFPGVTLDDYMRALWRSHGRSERPYANDDLRRALGMLVRDQRFADAFFADSVAGSRLPDYAPLLAQAGMVLRPAHPERGWLGTVNVVALAGKVMTYDSPAAGTPVALAGLGKGDRLLELDGQALETTAAVTTRLQALRPGDTVALRFEQRGVVRETTLTALADPALEVVPIEATPNGRLTDAQRRFRADWLRLPPG